MATKITVHAVDRDCAMGDDLVLEIDPNSRLDEFFQLLSERKKIPKCRMVVRLPPDRRFLWQNGRCGDRADWSLRRLGVSSRAPIVVQPTFPLAWLWEDEQWYEDKYLAGIKAAIEEAPQQALTLQELAVAVEKPSPIMKTLRTFLRQYPDSIAMETNVGNGVITCRINKHQLMSPIFV